MKIAWPNRVGALLLLGVLSLSAVAAPESELQSAAFTPEALRADLSALEAALQRIHPDLTHSVTAKDYQAAIANVKGQLNRKMTAHEAWTVLCQLNEVLADAHLVVAYPGGAAAEIKRHVQNNGKLFPFNVYVDPSGELFIRSKLDGGATPLMGNRIEAIDGKSGSEIAKQLLPCASGETAALRAALLSLRFSFFYWKLIGERESFRIKVAGTESLVDGSGTLPAAYADSKFEDVYKFDMRGAGAVLTVDTFAWGDKPKFYAFTKDAFTRMKAAGTKTLVIDIRANTGGDDDMWIEGIMPYIATTGFRNGSDYLLKVIEGRPVEGHKVGDVFNRSQSTTYPSAADNPLRFTGKVYVLIGPATYSSSILFTNVSQDMHFATIAGTGGAARGVQSGGTQNVILPSTGIGVVVPRFILQRPSGAQGLLQPDLLVPDDPFRPQAALEVLLRR